MNNLLNTIRKNWFPASTVAKNNFSGYISIDKSIEHVVSAVDPKMRVISRYDKKLKKPVEIALSYLNELVSVIPVEEDFPDQSDFLTSLLFKDQQEQDKVLGTSDDLKDFLLQDNNYKLSLVYFLLCMEKKEHTFFGVEQHGEILMRDVQHQSISFTGHQILAPAATPIMAKEGFKQCAFDGLIGKIIANIMQLNFEYKKLIESKSKTRNTYERNNNKPSFLNPYTGSGNEALQIDVSSASTINDKINKIKMDIVSPESHLQQTIEILNHPQDFIKVKRTPVYVDKSGVITGRDADKTRYCINAAQVDINHSYKRIAVVASYPVEKLTRLFH